MTSVGFYHLTTTDLEQALPSLLIRTLQQKEKGLVLCKDDMQMKRLTEALWRVTHPIWLPHGCHASGCQDAFPEWQPIWLTLFPENLNQASFLFMANGGIMEEMHSFKRVFDLFDGKDEQAVQSARERWMNFKQAGYDLTYWRQTEKGWEKG